jgi:hypothetical protein
LADIGKGEKAITLRQPVTVTRIQPVEQPPAHVFPRDRLDVPGVNVGDSALISSLHTTSS